MNTKTKKVYYCEFCKKHGLCAGVISRHEKSCTANPDRICRLCGTDSIKGLIEKYKGSHEIEESTQPFPIGQTIKIKWKDGKEVKAEDILDDVDGCPNCALTILRVCKMTGFPFSIKFDYKEELNKWWVEKNARAHEEDERCYIL